MIESAPAGLAFVAAASVLHPQITRTGTVQLRLGWVGLVGLGPAQLAELTSRRSRETSGDTCKRWVTEYRHRKQPSEFLRRHFGYLVELCKRRRDKGTALLRCGPARRPRPRSMDAAVADRTATVKRPPLAATTKGSFLGNCQSNRSLSARDGPSPEAN